MHLLLLPGTLCDAAVWAPIIDGVADLVPCVTGETGSHDSIPAITEALLRRHSGRLAVAGFSFGGFVALHMAARAPERLGGLALIGTTPLPLPEEQRPERLRRLAVAEAQGVEAYVRALMPVYVHPDHLEDAGLAATITGMATRLGIDVLRRQMLANINRPDARAGLASLGVPTMVLCGTADPICPPEDHRAMAAAIPGAVLSEIPGAGHFVTLEQPGPVVAAMRDWLARVAAADQT